MSWPLAPDPYLELAEAPLLQIHRLKLPKCQRCSRLDAEELWSDSTMTRLLCQRCASRLRMVRGEGTAL